MKYSRRFENAVDKLYNAFHDGNLNPNCHSQCAVGNIFDNTTAWQHLTEHHGSGKLSYVGLVHERLGRRFNGFTPKELLAIEIEFLKGCGFQLPLKNSKLKMNQDKLFNGLNAVVELLCQLDGIPNVMDCSALFDYSTEKDSKTEEPVLV